jgi:hypothetical protein
MNPYKATPEEKFAVFGRSKNSNPTRVIDGKLRRLEAAFPPPPVHHGGWEREDWVRYVDSSGSWRWRVVQEVQA